MIHMQLNVLISIGTKYINAQNLLDCFIYLFSIIIEPLLFTRYTLYRYTYTLGNSILNAICNFVEGILICVLFFFIDNEF